MARTPLEALPDLSDVQVIIRTPFPRQAPRIVEDQVTYRSPPRWCRCRGEDRARVFVLRRFVRVHHLRGRHRSLLGAFARAGATSRRCSRVCRRRPGTALGPDATGVGWVYQYALVDRSDPARPGELRALPGLVPQVRVENHAGRSRGASVGGMVRASTRSFCFRTRCGLWHHA